MEKELLCILKKYETHPDFFGDTIKDINQVGGMDDTVLHIAARNNSLNDALVFLQNGALIDFKGDLGYTSPTLCMHVWKYRNGEITP